MNPIDAYLQEREKVAADRTKAEHELVMRWKSDPSPDNTKSVLQQFEPVFRHHQNVHKAPQTSAVGLRGNMMNLAIDALKTYDPDRGATFSTHLHNQLRRVSRTNKKRQNMARIAETPAGYIGKIQAAQEELSDELGAEPSHEQIAQRMNIGLPQQRQLTARRIQQIQGMQRRDVLSTPFESDPVPIAAQRESEVIGLLRHSLGPEEQRLYDLMYPQQGGMPVTSTGVLAQRLGLSPSKVSRLKGSIIKKYEQYK
jgi:DNA-directed RNA polymerase specialized sigma subunit